MAFDEFNEKITPAVCISNGPTSAFSILFGIFEHMKSPLELILS